MTRRPSMLVIGYPSRLVADHSALIDAATDAGFDVELIAPARLGLLADDDGERVLVDGAPVDPDVVLPRGVNRPWPFVRQVLDAWQRRGVEIVPSTRSADVCADKLTTTRALVAAGVAVLPTIGVAPDEGVRITPLQHDAPLIAKPARASKARGVERFATIDATESALGTTRPLQAGMVDHHVVQPLASEWGVDYRVVVAWAAEGRRVIAMTERHAPDGVVTTNTAGSTAIDVVDPEISHPDVAELAIAATDALDLDFGGIDVIRHRGRAVVLEANAWPGLAAEAHGRRLADALVAVARERLA